MGGGGGWDLKLTDRLHDWSGFGLVWLWLWLWLWLLWGVVFIYMLGWWKLELWGGIRIVVLLLPWTIMPIPLQKESCRIGFASGAAGLANSARRWRVERTIGHSVRVNNFCDRNKVHSI